MAAPRPASPHAVSTPGFFDPAFDNWAADTGTSPAPKAAAAPPRAPRRRRGAALVVALAATLVGLTLVGPASANADPSSDAWYRLRMCESSDNYAINTGNGYYGAYQFDLSTWRSVGGSGYPNQASRAEQDARALQLYRMRGWQPWTCATILGLRADADAGSGRPVSAPTTPAPPATGTPAWPGAYYSYGDHSTVSPCSRSRWAAAAPR